MGKAPNHFIAVLAYLSVWKNWKILPVQTAEPSCPSRRSPWKRQAGVFQLIASTGGKKSKIAAIFPLTLPNFPRKKLMTVSSRDSSNWKKQQEKNFLHVHDSLKNPMGDFSIFDSSLHYFHEFSQLKKHKNYEFYGTIIIIRKYALCNIMIFLGTFACPFNKRLVLLQNKKYRGRF